MKNADESAFPVIHRKQVGNRGQCLHNDTVYGGFTKREMIAMHAMQGYISGQLAWTDGFDGGSAGLTAEEAAKEAVNYADALLEELDK